MCQYENYDQSFGSSRFVLELMREKPTHSLIEFVTGHRVKISEECSCSVRNTVFRYVSTHPTPPPNRNLATSQSLYICNNNRAVTCKFCSCKLCQFGPGPTLGALRVSSAAVYHIIELFPLARIMHGCV